ncbi:hypothetical protein SAMN05428987_3099 [Paenibacillus sp. CF095]|uniref:hypothetical protein n=1 Tax=Paenibacillus sp. CF095 TaxID=1881033 RepID=UPI00088238C5|nr:hypothetical protein [Paenibacillus sp. CF095]SDC86689.1 hypothetical protein SAMN05428987_3099 [Paenibacillus sp. CF095]
MTSTDWINSNYLVVNDPYVGKSVYWGNGVIYYGILTPVVKFIEMFGDAIQGAIDSQADVKQAIRDSDPDNSKGFNNIL